MSCAGLLGAAGVGLAAAGTHSGGGDLARLAALFLLIHAAAVVGLAAYAANDMTGARAVAIGAVMLTGGAMAFSGDIATLAFSGRHLAPGIAPVGGMVLILGWLIVAAAPWIRWPRV